MAIFNKKEKQSFEAFLKTDFSADRFDELFDPIATDAFTLGQAFHLAFTAAEKDYSLPSIERFLRRANERFPNELIRAIRRSEAFLHPVFADAVLYLPLSMEDSAHQQAWEYLRNEDLRLRRQLESLVDGLVEYPTPFVLNVLVYWLHDEMANEGNEAKEFATRAYGVLIQNLIRKGAVVSDASAASISRADKNTVNELMCQAIQIIKDHYHLLTVKLQPYCYDSKFVRPIITEARVEFMTRTDRLNDWKVDGDRYTFNERLYEEKAAAEVDDEFKTDRKTYEVEVCINRLQTALSDLGLDKFAVSGEWYNYIDYVFPLLNISYSLEEVMETNGTIAAFKFISFDALLKENPHLNTQAFNRVLEELSVEQTNMNKIREDYNPSLLPFLKIDKNTFVCPSFVLAFNSFFYSIINTRLIALGKPWRKKERRHTNKIFEQGLVKIFEDHGWEAKWLGKHKPKNSSGREIKGDIDILVWDDNDQLAIQLKRTQLRLNLKEYNNEVANAEHTAFSQLGSAVKAMKNPNDTMVFTDTPTQWLVSTSYEATGKRSGDSIKVNYFDVLHAFRNCKFPNLRAFIDYIENDRLMDEFGHLLH